MGTLGQGCRLFKRCQNLSARHCGTGVQAASAVSEPTSLTLYGRGAGSLSVVRTYLPGTVEQGCRLFEPCCDLPGQGCRLFDQYGNLPLGQCWAVFQDVKAVSESTSQALWGRCASCLSDVGTCLQGTVG